MAGPLVTVLTVALGQQGRNGYYNNRVLKKDHMALVLDSSYTFTVYPPMVHRLDFPQVSNAPASKPLDKPTACDYSSHNIHAQPTRRFLPGDLSAYKYSCLKPSF